MIFKNVSFKTPEENILYDEVLLKLAEQGAQGEVLRLWESPMLFVVLGRISKVTEDVREDNTKKDNVPVLRRFSGGGTVLQGPGCLNYSLILSKKTSPQVADLRRSYQFVLERQPITGTGSVSCLKRSAILHRVLKSLTSEYGYSTGRIIHFSCCCRFRS